MPLVSFLDPLFLKMIPKGEETKSYAYGNMVSAAYEAAQKVTAEFLDYYVTFVFESVDTEESYNGPFAPGMAHIHKQECLLNTFVAAVSTHMVMVYLKAYAELSDDVVMWKHLHALLPKFDPAALMGASLH